MDEPLVYGGTLYYTFSLAAPRFWFGGGESRGNGWEGANAGDPAQKIHFFQRKNSTFGHISEEFLSFFEKIPKI